MASTYSCFECETFPKAFATVFANCSGSKGLGMESVRSQGDMTPVVAITGLTGTEIPERLRALGYVEVQDLNSSQPAHLEHPESISL
jgi:hypothetical protein